LLPEGVEYTEKFLLVNGKEIEVVINDNDLDELEKYGRFFVWAGFLPQKTIDDMLVSSVKLRDINTAVLQDLEDYIIAQGMEPLPSDYNKNKTLAKDDMRHIAELQEKEKEKKVFEFRPPNLWNEPSSLEENHDFKCSANPFKIYNDSRVRDLYNMIEQQAMVLRTNHKDQWNNLVSRVIDVYKDENAAQNESDL